jgi:hypothetical protein
MLPVTNNGFFRITSLAAIASSGLALMIAVAAIASIFAPGIMDIIVYVLMMITDVFIFFILTGAYFIQYQRVSNLGLAGYLIAIIGLLCNYIFAPLMWTLFPVGLLLLTIATQKARVLQPAPMWIWFLGVLIAIPMAILGATILFAFGMLTVAVGRAWLGIAVWNANETPVQPPAKVTETVTVGD